ncbi:MAG: 2-hydroxycarboxylate transporter family protein [Steroidobacteraceae bacterium]
MSCLRCCSAIGVTLRPCQTLVAAFALLKLLTIYATAATLIGSGFASTKWGSLHPLEAAIVTAANRMQLMPFAQIATRIRGALVVTLAPLSIAPFYEERRRRTHLVPRSACREVSLGRSACRRRKLEPVCPEQ